MPSSPSSRDDTSPSASSSLVIRQPKRRGVALSCAECRRLKLKCSRAFPCSNCVKKGCAAICPEGSLTTGKGNRFVLANTEALHEKITTLASRVRQLEDSLADSHARTSHTPHPLLSPELLQIKRPLERERLDVPHIEEKPETDDNIDSMGSLSISNDGRSTFFGQTANSWYLLQNEEGSEDDEDSSSSVHNSPEPTDPAWLSYAFPHTTAIGKSRQQTWQGLLQKLPSLEVARSLSSIYYRHAAWMYCPVPEEDFLEAVLRPLYESDNPLEPLAPHRMAVFWMVLAIGTLVDLDRPAHAPEAMKLYHYGRAALSIDSVLEEQSITGIQALMLICHFMFLSEISSARWVIMGIAVKLAQSIGLHRDSGKWKLDSEQTRKRRALFYELLTYDSWQSLTFGRPPSLSSVHIDNQLPHEATKNENGEMEMSFDAWKHKFSAQCLSVVHDQAFGARTPNYKLIQELDKKVRTWYVPPSLQVPGFGGAKLASTEVEQPKVQLTMQRYITFAIKEMSLFYMHRGFFAQALEDSPTDPMGSKYSPSVLAAYGSATSFVGLIESLFNQHPQLTERMWFLFTHVFSCAIVLGSIAQKSQMGLSRSALSHLDSAHNLFTKVTDHARAGKILPILSKLRDRAHMAQASSSLPLQPSESATRLSFYGPKIKSEVDELSALGGVTRLVSRRSSSSPSMSASSPQLQKLVSPTLAESATFLVSQANEGPSTWHNYTHVENFNVSINMGVGVSDYYQNGGPAVAQEPHGDVGMLYQIPPHEQQPQTHHHHHPHHHQQQQQQQHVYHSGAPMEMSNSMYYSMNGYPPVYGTVNGYPMVQGAPSPEMLTPPHDLQDSWQNLLAQYK
ncbi:hypothetical protein HYPSUDRAFT_45638 [Hypholoma sublateritium FD-334 SS-4]|uniref:Zn(2)-C6 fungal-type domain-containing protein n=1 Tax=Hypholoma sublateritium (strain FD-334 SS-4) TaxID=945553 RepID=A0A0D2NMU1_HYPSF|nr:hypothetical protein HYPSUDRAFT_45638 [Hypholoma sublateritium FD-334 SS-4]